MSLSRPRARALAAACAATSTITVLPAIASVETAPADPRPATAAPLPATLTRLPGTGALGTDALGSAGLKEIIDGARRRALHVRVRRERRGPQQRLRLSAQGRALVPAGAPRRVRRLIKAANRIAHLPYVWGGGHGSWQASGYDCSGSVGYVLHAAGVLDHAVTSGALTTYGRPGRGRWVSIYANGGHTYMVVAGVRFDTTAYKMGGSRWSNDMRGWGSYTVRHPAGL